MRMSIFFSLAGYRSLRKLRPLSLEVFPALLQEFCYLRHISLRYVVNRYGNKQAFALKHEEEQQLHGAGVVIGFVLVFVLKVKAEKVDQIIIIDYTLRAPVIFEVFPAIKLSHFISALVPSCRAAIISVVGWFEI